jgi:hypothetical protein
MLILHTPLPAADSVQSALPQRADTFIINEVSGPPDTSIYAPVKYIDYRDINIRARSMKLTAVSDAEPYIDNTAFFLLHPRIEFPVTGLEKGKRYNLFIDFVRYRGRKVPFDGIIKIFIRDAYGNEQLVGTVDDRVFYSDKIFAAEIPFNLSYTGIFTIIIHEYSMETGNRGIWDIIVTSKNIAEIDTIKAQPGPGLIDAGRIFSIKP